MTRTLTLLALLVGFAGIIAPSVRGEDEPAPVVADAAEPVENEPAPAVDSAEPGEDSTADGEEPAAESETPADAEEPADEGEAHADGKADGELHADSAEPGHGHKEGEEHDHHAETAKQLIEKHDADGDGQLHHSELSAVLGELLGAHEDEEVSPLPFDPDLAIFTVIVFVVLLLVLGKFAWGPIMDGLEKRESAVAEQIEQARENNEKAAAMLVEYEERLAAASQEAKAMVEEARRDSDATRERIVAEAEEAAARERQRAVEAIQLAKEAALHELTKRSVDQAVALAKGIVRRELNPQDHAELIQETLDKFPSRN